MTRVSGFLQTVTKEPSKVTGVWVRADRMRVSTTGLTTPEQEPVEWNPETGEVGFDAEPGDATLVLQYFNRTASVPISVPDVPTVTLEEVVSARFEYTPPVVNRGLELIESARDEAVTQVGTRFDEEVAGFFPLDSATPGMGLVWTGTGFRWSWMDRYVDVYSDQY